MSTLVFPWRRQGLHLSPMRALAFLCASASLVSLLSAEEHHLFHPVPDKELRTFTPERPGLIRRPYTVDAGHAMLEFEPFSYGRDDDNGTITRTMTISGTLRLGLTDDLELVAEGAPWMQRTVEGQSDSGRGASDVGVTWNWLGNNHELPYALAFTALVGLPTLDKKFGVSARELYLRMPGEYRLSDTISVHAEAGADMRRNLRDSGYTLVMVGAVGMRQEMTKSLDGLVELLGETSTEAGRENLVIGNIGAAWALGASAQVDGGLRLGLSDAAEDMGLVAGVSLRF